MIKMSLEHYLAERDCLFPISDFMDDKLQIPHGLSERQKKKLQKEAEAVRLSYHERRELAIKQFRQLIADGEIDEPSDKVSIRIPRALALGSVKKRDIDWRNTV